MPSLGIRVPSPPQFASYPLAVKQLDVAGNHVAANSRPGLPSTVGLSHSWSLTLLGLLPLPIALCADLGPLTISVMSVGGEGAREQGESTEAQGVGSETHETHVVASPFGVTVIPAQVSALKSRAMVLGAVGAEGGEASCNFAAAHGTRPDLVAPAVFTAGVPMLLLLLAHDTFGHSATLEVCLEV